MYLKKIQLWSSLRYLVTIQLLGRMFRQETVVLLTSLYPWLEPSPLNTNTQTQRLAIKVTNIKVFHLEPGISWGREG